MKFKSFAVFLIFFSMSAEGETMSQMDRIKDVFTNLRADNVDMLDDFYSENVHFEDPLGIHSGRSSVKNYYKNLYQNVTFIEFEYTDTISNGPNHLLVWTMKLKADGLNGGDMVVVGGNSVIKFGTDDLVSYHRDYFDMGEFIYEQVPVLKWVIGKVKEKLKN